MRWRCLFWRCSTATGSTAHRSVKTGWPEPKGRCYWTSALEGTSIAAKLVWNLPGPLPANQSWEQVNLAALWNWREEGATVNGAVDRDRHATVENRPQMRIKFAQPCEQ